MKKTHTNTHKQRASRRLLAAPALGGLLLSFGMMQSAQAAEVSCPNAALGGDPMYCFRPNTPAKSGQVNANFKHLVDLIAAQEALIAGLTTRLDAAESTIATLTGTVTTATTDLTALTTRMTTAETDIDNAEIKLAPVIYTAGGDNWQLSGVNLQVINGMGSSDSNNGKGNLIVGYNETADRAVCSNGLGFDEASCLAATPAGVWAANQRGGSHNVVIGEKHNYTQHSGLVSGYDNAIVGEHATVSGGTKNTAAGNYASVSGGESNQANGISASVSGGQFNVANGQYAGVSGGNENRALAEHSSVSGGTNNTADGHFASVTGGGHNLASGEGASVTGGGGTAAGSNMTNTAAGDYASVTGGGGNTANGARAVVNGGQDNQAHTDDSTVSGGIGNATIDPAILGEHLP